MSGQQDAPRRICVYCASQTGNNPNYALAAAEVGEALAEHGCDLVYGGGNVGLMGVVANTMLDAGRAVTGVITRHLYDLERGNQAVTELLVVEDMSARKREMFARADGFVILPGGLGTLEELFEVWCWAALGLHPKPFGLLNTDGYYDPLIAFMQRGVDDGMLDDAQLRAALVEENARRLVQAVLSS